MARAQSPTSGDVARRAGVSRGMVSVVLNGARGNVRVAPATRERILAVASDLGYRPNRAAQALRRRQSGVIGFVPRTDRGSMFEEPITLLLSIELARAAARRGYHVIEASAETAASRETIELARFLNQWDVDAVIADCPKTLIEIERLLDIGVPVIQLFRPIADPRAAEVTVDPHHGINAATDHLVQLNHTNIAFIGSDQDHPIDRARRDAFTTAMTRHHLALPPEYSRLVNSYYSPGGYDAMKALLELPTRHRPTAVFAAGDPLAGGALRALHEARVWVPDAMSLISYDDAYVANLTPPLTSVAQPFGEIAERAIDLALSERGTPNHAEAAPTVVLSTELIVRASTAPAADHDPSSRSGQLMG